MGSALCTCPAGYRYSPLPGTCSNLMGSALCTCPAGYRYCPPAPAPVSHVSPLQRPSWLQVLPSSTCTNLTDSPSAPSLHATHATVHLGSAFQATDTTFPLDLYQFYKVRPLHLPSTGYRYFPCTCTNLKGSALCTFPTGSTFHIQIFSKFLSYPPLQAGLDHLDMRGRERVPGRARLLPGRVLPEHGGRRHLRVPGRLAARHQGQEVRGHARGNLLRRLQVILHPERFS